MGINAKKKGNAGENNFANWLRDNGIKAWKDSASGAGTREKADVGCNIGLHFEIKTCKAINLKKVWEQTERGASMTHNTPVAVIHFDGMPKDNWLIVMDNYSWLEFLKKDEGLKTDYIDPNLKYKLMILINTCKEIIKKLEK